MTKIAGKVFRLVIKELVLMVRIFEPMGIFLKDTVFSFLRCVKKQVRLTLLVCIASQVE